jgi:hypothetical protein
MIFSENRFPLFRIMLQKNELVAGIASEMDNTKPGIGKTFQERCCFCNASEKFAWLSESSWSMRD